MKIVTLNIWGGRTGKDKVLSFFRKYKNDVDVFCLQEVWASPEGQPDGILAGGVKIYHKIFMTRGRRDISEVMPEFVRYFHKQFADFGLLSLVHKSLTVVEDGDVFVHIEKETSPNKDIGKHSRNIQYMKLDIKNKPLTIINFHGLWNGEGKTDTEDRLEQSKNILNFLNGIKGDFVFCGDFNLRPDTKSIKMLEDAGYRNLIKEYDIKSTRTSYYKKDERHADYIFISNGLRVKDFKVLPDEVSDHAALYLEIED